MFQELCQDLYYFSIHSLSASPNLGGSSIQGSLPCSWPSSSSSWGQSGVHNPPGRPLATEPTPGGATEPSPGGATESSPGGGTEPYPGGPQSPIQGGPRAPSCIGSSSKATGGEPNGLTTSSRLGAEVCIEGCLKLIWCDCVVQG